MNQRASPLNDRGYHFQLTSSGWCRRLRPALVDLRAALVLLQGLAGLDELVPVSFERVEIGDERLSWVPKVIVPGRGVRLTLV